MTKPSTKSTKQQKKNIADPYSGLSDLNTDLFENYLLASQKMLDNAFALNEELLRFAGSRFEKDMEAFQNLSQCQNSDEVISLQSDFMRTTAEDYQAEISKLVEQGTTALKEFSGDALYN